MSPNKIENASIKASRTCRVVNSLLAYLCRPQPQNRKFNALLNILTFSFCFLPTLFFVVFVAFVNTDFFFILVVTAAKFFNLCVTGRLNPRRFQIVFYVFLPFGNYLPTTLEEENLYFSKCVLASARWLKFISNRFRSCTNSASDVGEDARHS